MGITIALSVVILFLSLFFIFSRYVVDGQLIIPWLMDDVPTASASVEDETEDDESPDGEDLSSDPMDATPSDTTPIFTTPSVNENPLVMPPGDDDLNTFIPDAVDTDTIPPDDEP